MARGRTSSPSRRCRSIDLDTVLFQLERLTVCSPDGLDIPQVVEVGLPVLLNLTAGGIL